MILGAKSDPIDEMDAASAKLNALGDPQNLFPEDLEKHTENCRRYFIKLYFHFFNIINLTKISRPDERSRIDLRVR